VCPPPNPFERSVLAALWESPNGAVFAKDGEGRFRFLSEGLCRLLGRSRESLLGANSSVFLTPQAHEDVLRQDREVLRSGGALSYEQRVETPSGARILHGIKQALHGEDGKVMGILGVAMDVTDQKEAAAEIRATQQTLARRETHLNLLLKHAPAALALFDRDMRYLAVSQRWLEDYSLTEQEALGRSYYEVFPVIPDAWRKAHTRGLAGETIRNEEDRFLRADGRVQWLRWEVRPWLEPDYQIGGLMIFTEDITSRKETEQQLKFAHAELVAALGSMSDAVYISDAQGNLVEANAAFATFHKFPSKEAFLRQQGEAPPLTEVRRMDGSTVSWDQCPMSRALRGEASSGEEFAIRRLDSGEAWIANYSYAPIREPDGTIAGSVVVGRDVTDQKASEAALARQAEMLQLATQSADLGIWDMDLGTGQVTWDANLYTLLGVTPAPDQDLFALWLGLIHPEDRPRVMAMFPHCQTSRTPVTFEFRFRRPDGEERIAKTTSLARHDASGAATHLVGTHLDITAFRTAERQVRESEERRVFALTHSHVGFWELDPATLRGRRSSEHARIFGYPEGDSEWSLERFLGHIPEADRGTPLRVIQEGRTQGRDLNFEIPIRRLDGAHRWIGVAGGFMRDAAGQVIRIAGTTQDITERKEAEASRRELEAQLHHLQRLEMVGRLVSGVSHDMNNVLTSIMTIASSLTFQYPKDPRLAKDAEILLRASERGRDLVADLRDHSRKDLGGMGSVCLNDLVRHEADLLDRTSLKRIRVDLDLTDPLPCIQGTPSILANALMNLCQNARDAMPKGGTLTLRTSATDEEGVSVIVEDTGEGMPPEVQAQALEPFFTTKPLGIGTGLGLAQVSAAMKAHGGTLSIQSEVGRGTRITLTFPRTRTPIPTHSVTLESNWKSPLPRRRILLVDDDEMVRLSLAHTLILLGQEVFPAPSGAEALAFLQSGKPVDLVITDLNMPDMDGLATITATRALRPDLPILLTSGFMDERVSGLLQAFPDARLLPKPCGLAEVRRALLSWEAEPPTDAR